MTVEHFHLYRQLDRHGVYLILQGLHVFLEHRLDSLGVLFGLLGHGLAEGLVGSLEDLLHILLYLQASVHELGLYVDDVLAVGDVDGLLLLQHDSLRGERLGVVFRLCDLSGEELLLEYQEFLLVCLLCCFHLLAVCLLSLLLLLGSDLVGQ